MFWIGTVVLSLLLGGFFNFADPDYFWHYKAGEYIVGNHTVPARDLFSFSMPDFPWVNHEWLSDTILFWIEDNAGQRWLGVFYLVLFWTAMLVLGLMKKRLNYFDAAVGLIGVVLLLSAVGVRQQTWSILFFVILLGILERWRDKYIWFLPPLFLIWTNVHGGFALGLLVLAFYSAVEFFKQSYGGKYPKQLLVVFLISIATTFLNPYGFRIYEEVLRTASDSFLARHISEWRSLILIPHVILRFAVFFAFMLALLPGIHQRISVPRQIFLLVLFLASLKSFKYLPYFIIAVLPVLWLATDKIMASTRREHLKPAFFSRQGVWLWAASVIVGLLFFKPDLIFRISYPAYPSNEAIRFLSTDGGQRVFNFYGWGGYLIRYAPERRYFIDGRMPSWRTKDVFAFGDYIDLSSCGRIDEIIDKYKLDTVIWPIVSAELSISSWLRSNELENLSERISEKIFGAKPECGLLKELAQRGWAEKFKDSNTVILRKN